MTGIEGNIAGKVSCSCCQYTRPNIPPGVWEAPTDHSRLWVPQQEGQCSGVRGRAQHYVVHTQSLGARSGSQGGFLLSPGAAEGSIWSPLAGSIKTQGCVSHQLPHVPATVGGHNSQSSSSQQLLVFPSAPMNNRVQRHKGRGGLETPSKNNKFEARYPRQPSGSISPPVCQAAPMGSRL